MTDAYDRAVARIEKFLNGVSLAMDAGEHWVTVNAGSASGGEGGGSHVMLDGEGRVKAGMGGKFTGTRIDDIPRKKFMNEQAYQRKQERDAQEAKASAPASAPAQSESQASGSTERVTLSPDDMRKRLDDAGLKKWTSGDGNRERYYVRNGKDGDKQINDLFGVEVERYNTGNIKYCAVDGEKISNGKARGIVYALENGAYYDAKEGTWHGVPDGITPRLHGEPERRAPAAAKPDAKAEWESRLTPKAKERLAAVRQQSEKFRSDLATPGGFKARLDADKDTMMAAAAAVNKHYYSEPLKEGHHYMKIPSPIVRESDRAVAIAGRGDSYLKNGELQYRDTVWLPKSQIDIKDGNVVGLSNWIAEEKGIAPLGYQYKTTVQGNTARASRELSKLPDEERNRELVLLGRMRNSGNPLPATVNQAASSNMTAFYRTYANEDGGAQS